MECVNYVAVSVNWCLTLVDKRSVIWTFIHPWVNRFQTLGIRRRVWQVGNLPQDLAIGAKLIDISHVNKSCYISYIIIYHSFYKNFLEWCIMSRWSSIWFWQEPLVRIWCRHFCFSWWFHCFWIADFIIVINTVFV